MSDLFPLLRSEPDELQAARLAYESAMQAFEAAHAEHVSAVAKARLCETAADTAKRRAQDAQARLATIEYRLSKARKN